MSCKLRCHLYSEEECKTVCRYAMNLAGEIPLVKEARVAYLANLEQEPYSF